MCSELFLGGHESQHGHTSYTVYQQLLLQCDHGPLTCTVYQQLLLQCDHGPLTILRNFKPYKGTTIYTDHVNVYWDNE